ncbi:hypothetical protein psyc5s11_40780 [Clostridium gelidum]|uniref:DUF378 domain-containing protein n=1 Tax=Clostridium gelidum TaxID=704125 RepID=A0ABN6J2A6_9CLOT|nr:DUF378 domain-containing protein [Clostridium gelidum]BCZ48011.1 hypothetical protein psyc5s11_40780 [Clostridium gelidum]
MCKLNIFDKLSFLLVFIGSVNWGIIGLFDLNLVTVISLNSSLIERIIYILILFAAVDLVIVLFRCNLIIDDN